MMMRRRISRRGFLARTAAASAVLLPMRAVAEPRNVKFTLAWLAQGSFAYVARAMTMKPRGIDLEIARGWRRRKPSQPVNSSLALSRRRP
jgi:hypothetical protein